MARWQDALLKNLALALEYNGSPPAYIEGQFLGITGRQGDPLGAELPCDTEMRA